MVNPEPIAFNFKLTAAATKKPAGTRLRKSWPTVVHSLRLAAVNNPLKPPLQIPFRNQN
jgi:hypothetical protein